ncbi:MAG: hypothetical protein AAF597_00725 [Bacteroidota bacterium]
MKNLIVIVLCSLSLPLLLAQAGQQTISLDGATELSVEASLSGVVIVASPTANVVTVNHVMTVDGVDRPDLRKLAIKRSGKRISVSELRPTSELLSKDRGDRGMTILHNGGNDWPDDHRGIRVRAYLEVTVPEEMVITAQTLYGGIEAKGVKFMPVARSTYGVVEVVFAPDCRIETLDYTSEYQSVDVAIPADIAANITLNTSYGSMYSDFDYRVPASSKGVKRDGKLVGTINGGGVPISLTATYQNIYLRKL